MRALIVVAIVAALAGCRGEPVPRDYQNAPPDMTQPAASSTATPAAHGMGQPSPQPSTGVEGKTQPPPAPSTTIEDSAPVTTPTSTPTSTTT